jgi:hypothetical protein
MVEDEMTIIRNEMAFHYNLGTYEWDSWLCYYKDEDFCGTVVLRYCFSGVHPSQAIDPKLRKL